MHLPRPKRQRERLGSYTLAAIGCLLFSNMAAAIQPLADVVFENGRVLTLNHHGIAQAFAVHAGKFLAVGTNHSMEPLLGPDTKHVDLLGATVMPGLTDSHDHLWNSAKYLTRGVDLVGVNTLAELQNRLRSAIARSSLGDVIFTTTGWSVVPGPTRRDLDALSASTPIVLIARRRGVGILNTPALLRLGITRDHPVYMGARVPLDADGEPTGAPPPYPTSVSMIDALLPKMSDAEQESMVRRAMAERNSLGITSIREMAVWPDAVIALRRMRDKHELTVRMALGIEFPDVENTGRYLAQMTVDRSDPWLFVDCNAEEPWPPGSASEAEFALLSSTEAKLGWRPAPHVSSDSARGISYDDATDQTLSAYESVNSKTRLNGKRWYIEHVPFATTSQIVRMKGLGLMVSTQDYGYRTSAANQSADRLERQNPIRDFLEHHLIVIAGSDYAGPTPSEREPNNPMIPFYFYTTRKSQSGETRAPSQIVTREQALRMFTVNPAFATFQEKVKGRIAPGMFADFAILNQDLMTVPDSSILNTRVLATYVGGKMVYRASDFQFRESNQKQHSAR